MIAIQSCNVTVMVAGLERAIDFYVGALGLKLINRYGDHWADVEGPGIAIGLHPTQKVASRGDNLQIAFRVADLDKAVAVLKNAGVQARIKEDGQVRLASFRDPDGNALYLVE